MTVRHDSEGLSCGRRKDAALALDERFAILLMSSALHLFDQGLLCLSLLLLVVAVDLLGRGKNDHIVMKLENRLLSSQIRLREITQVEWAHTSGKQTCDEPAEESVITRSPPFTVEHRTTAVARTIPLASSTLTPGSWKSHDACLVVIQTVSMPSFA